MPLGDQERIGKQFQTVADEEPSQGVTHTTKAQPQPKGAMNHPYYRNQGRPPLRTADGQPQKSRWANGPAWSSCSGHKDREMPSHGENVLGQAAGIVRAEHIHTCQFLDGGQPGHDGSLLRQQARSHRHGHEEHRGHRHGAAPRS